MKSRKKGRFAIKLNRKIIYFVALALAFTHIFLLAIILISPNRGLNAFGQTTVLAVTMGQELDSEVFAEVIVIEHFDADNLAIGDKVVIFGKYGTDLYWVEQVVAINRDTGTLDTTFDGFIANQVKIADVDGIYLNAGNLIHRVNYVGSTTMGFISLVALYALLFAVTYYLYIKKTNEPIS